HAPHVRNQEEAREISVGGRAKQRGWPTEAKRHIQTIPAEPGAAPDRGSPSWFRAASSSCSGPGRGAWSFGGGGIMNVDTDNGGRLPTAPLPRRAPRCNLISVGAPFLGALAVVGFLWVVGTDGHWYWTWRGPVAMGILAGPCFVGIVLAFVALARSERLWGLTVVGLVLNAPLPLLLLWNSLWYLESWLRYG